MQNTITYQILRANTDDEIKQDNIISVNVATIMAHDGSGPVVSNALQSNEIKYLKGADRTVFNFDHYYPAKTQREAYLHKKAREFSYKNNFAIFIGEGISHFIMAEKKMLKPGSVLVGGDSHTCTSGAFGLFAIGLGATDVSGVIATGKLWLEVPGVVRIKLINALKPGISAFDLALYIVRKVGFNGALGKSLEFFGPAVKSLSILDRMKISNFSVEMGAISGVFEIDETCRQWHINNGIPEKDIPEFAYSDYSDYTIDLSDVPNLIAKPDKPSNSVNVDDINEKISVDQVFIGSCSGGNINDIKEAAAILKGKKVNSNTRLLVGPATKKTLNECMEKGYIKDLSDAGATILPVGCGACLGNIGALADDETEVSTQNRNFTGRVGSKKAKIYLASAGTAAKVAMAGYIGKD